MNTLHYYTITVSKLNYRQNKKSGCLEFLGATPLVSGKMTDGMFNLSGLCLLELGQWLSRKTGIRGDDFQVREHIGTAYNAVIACGSNY